LEYDLLVLVKQEHQDVLTSLKTIPKIRNKAAVMLVVFTEGFNRFKSGSSLNGRSTINKIGN